MNNLFDIKTLRSQSFKLFRRGLPRLIGLTSLSLFLIFASVSLLPFTFAGSMIIIYPTVPLFFMLTLEVNGLVSGSRSERFSFGLGYMTYFSRGRGLFRVLRSLSLSLLLGIAVYFVSIFISTFYIKAAMPDLYAVIISAGDVADLLGKYQTDLYPVYSLSWSFALFFAIALLSAESRKNEMSFYCFNTLLSDNKYRITPLPMTIALFRKEIFPKIHREYTLANLKVNWPGYVLYVLGFAGGLTIGLLFNIYPFFTVMIAFGLAFFLYIPFYSYARIFDNLFFVQAAALIESRLQTEVRQELLSVKNKVMSQQGEVFSSADDRDPTPPPPPERPEQDDQTDGGGITLTEEEKKRLSKEEER